MKAFYHSADLDGHCSGALVKIVHPKCEMIGINYGDEFPWEGIVQGERIFMVDFSLQPFSDMVRLHNNCSLIWIDHHKSAIEEAQKTGWEIDESRLKVGIGACQIVYEYFKDLQIIPGFVPTFVKLLAEYDVWNHKDPRTLPFQYGMRQQRNTDPENIAFWRSLFDVEEVQRITEIGGIIIEYQNVENEKYCKARSFEIEVDGLKCIAINRGMTNSKIFDSVWDNTKYDAMLTFCLVSPEKGWTISLYSDKEAIDVSEIAKRRGGGGHKGAAGFQAKELPFL